MSQELRTYADQLERQFANANMAGIAVSVRVKDPEFLIELMRKSAGMLEEAERALEPFVAGAGDTMAFLRSHEKMYPAGQELYLEDVRRARATLSKIRGE